MNSHIFILRSLIPLTSEKADYKCTTENAKILTDITDIIQAQCCIGFTTHAIIWCNENISSYVININTSDKNK